MRIFFLGPITEEALLEELSNRVEGGILNYQRISSKYKRKPYEIKSELDEEYLERVRKTVNEVGDFVGGFLRGFFSYQRVSFDYVRRHKVEFLSECELLAKVRVKTDKEEKEISLSLGLPSFIYLPIILYRIKGQYVYLYNHLGSRISFVIGNRENAKSADYFIDDALEELWHLAIYPHLIEKLNRNLKIGQLAPSESAVAKILVKEGELLSKAFALASLREFAQRRGYNIFLSRKLGGKEEVLVEKLRRMGIRKALKEVSKPGVFEI